MEKTPCSLKGEDEIMNAGDMVRFREKNEATWSVGILVEYEKLLKVAKILSGGKLVSIRAAMVQLHERHPDNVEMLKQNGEKK